MQYRNRRKACQPNWRFQVDSVLDELLPGRCMLCGFSCPRDNLCAGCLDDMPFNENACEGCGLECPGLTGGRCGPCLVRAPAWDRVIAGLRYQFPVDVLVHKLKYQRNLAAGRALSRATCETLDPGLRSTPLLLVPVPLHWSRELSRGYNQAYEIARHFSRWTDCPLLEGRLCRLRRTVTQTGLDAASRRRNLRGAFRWRGPSLAGARVALVDDVMTTGATAAACSTTLRGAGAGRIEVWVAARAAAPGQAC